MNLTRLMPMIPEIFVLIMACFALLAGVFAPKRRQLVYALSQVTLLVAAWLVWHVFNDLAGGATISVFREGFVLDHLAVMLKFLILLSVFFVFIYSNRYNLGCGIAQNEFYVLGLLSTLGMMVLVSAHSLLTVYMGMELLSLPTYAMVGMRRDRGCCVEAAMKYFIIGAVASGFLLYGFSMLFGATHSLNISEIAHVIAVMPEGNHVVLILGMIFVVAGIIFKLGAAPFHMWVPDVYEGAPTSVTLFIASAPKMAAFGMAIRLLVDAMPVLHVQWQAMLIVIALLSMGVGNLMAIAQTNIKRMLAYSSVAHMGYMILGLACATSRGYAASMFYVVTYTLMTLAAFGVILLMSQKGFEAEEITDLAGLNNRNPWLAFVMLVVMFSMAGVPPLVGFVAKVGVLEALIQVHLVWLTVVALLFAVIGSYYYIRVVKVMYFERGEKTDAIVYPLDMKIAISLNGIVVLLLGLFPGWLFAMSHISF